MAYFCLVMHAIAFTPHYSPAIQATIQRWDLPVLREQVC